MAEQRVALVTGGTDGIGKATAKKLLSDGWQVVITGRNASRGDAALAELRTATASDRASAITADLSRMADVKKLAESFLATHAQLDFLFLNANAITQERVVTSEGFESNFALGYLGRVLLTWNLEEVMASTPAAQIFTVVGLNTARLDFDDLTLASRYSGKEALGRWQWAMQVFARDFNGRSRVPTHVYMPGLVRTKILADEPQPMRLLVKVMNALVGISVEEAASNVAHVLAASNKPKGSYYAWKKPRSALDLKLRPGDTERLSEITTGLLKAYV